MVLRWGILGAGNICTDFVKAHPLSDTTNNVIEAVAARDLKRANEFAKAFKIPKAYGSYKELAEDPDVDVVYVGTINAVHYDNVKLVLENNKHVLCEKPLMLNSKQVNDVFELAQKKNKFLIEAVWSRFFPSYERIRCVVKSGEIGEVRMVTANFIKTSSKRRERSLGGGGLLDLGMYGIQLSTMIFDEEPEKICATGEISEFDVDRIACVTLHYSDGRMAQFNIGTDTVGPCNGHIIGTKGIIELEQPFHCPLSLVVNGKTEVFPITGVSDKEEFPSSNSAGFCYEWNAVGDAIHKGLLEHPLMSQRHSRIICSVLDECRKQIGVSYDADQ